MSSSPRITPVIPGSRPALAAIERQIGAERGRISALYQVLLNSAPLAEGWEKLLTALRNRSSVPPDLREMVILRVAVLNDAPFEFEAHVPHARNAGVEEEKLQALRATTLGHPLSPGEVEVLRLADEMTINIRVPDAVFDAVRKRFDEQSTVELVATIAAYNMVSRFLEALRIGH